jgi:hypothetical protein
VFVLKVTSVVEVEHVNLSNQFVLLDVLQIQIVRPKNLASIVCVKMFAPINVDQMQFVESKDTNLFAHANKASMEIPKLDALKLAALRTMNVPELIRASIVNVFPLVHWKNVEQIQCVLQ